MIGVAIRDAEVLNDATNMKKKTKIDMNQTDISNKDSIINVGEGSVVLSIENALSSVDTMLCTEASE